MSIDKQLHDRITKRIDELFNALSGELEKNVKTCISCNSFDESTETCKMFEQRPPARIIAFGCEHFNDDIPF